MGRKLSKPLSPVMRRIEEALQVEGLKGIAAALRLAETTVRNWHLRDNVPTDWVMTVADRSGRTVDWLLKGPDMSPFFRKRPLPVKKSATADAFGQEKEVTEKPGTTHVSPSTALPNSAQMRPNVKQCVAMDAGPVLYGEGPAKPVNSALLASVLDAVLIELAQQNIELPSSKLAELTALLYEDAVGSDVADRAGQMQHSARRYLRLVS